MKGDQSEERQWESRQTKCNGLLDSGIDGGPTFTIFGFFFLSPTALRLGFFLDPTDDIFKFDFFPHVRLHILLNQLFFFSKW